MVGLGASMCCRRFVVRRPSLTQRMSLMKLSSGVGRGASTRR